MTYNKSSNENIEPPFNYNKRKFNTLKIHPPYSKLPIYSRKIYLNNNLIFDKATKKRIQSLGIPPAYVKKISVVAKSPDNDIQFMGVNDKHQVQYIYHPNHTKRQTREKYINVQNLGRIIPRIETDVTTQIQNISKKQNIARDDLFSIILYMLIKYHFRIGNIKYSNMNKSYGITTLKPNHIHLKSYPQFEIKFIGKKGIENKITDNNSSMWRILSKLSKNNINNFIFQLNGNDLISPKMMKEYLVNKYKTYITPKMFRTWYANYHLLDYLQKHKSNVFKAENKREQKQCVNDAVQYVSIKLNNTPGISRKAYVNNKMFNIILNNPKSFIKQIPRNDIHQYLMKIMKKI